MKAWWKEGKKEGNKVNKIKRENKNEGMKAWRKEGKKKEIKLIR